MAAPELCEGIVEVKADKLAWLLAALTLALNSSAVLLGLLNGYNPWSLLFLVTAVSAAIVGGVIGWRQPANRVGWIIAGFALCFTLGEFSRQYTVYAVFTQPGTLPFTPLMAGLLDLVSWSYLSACLPASLLPLRSARCTALANCRLAGAIGHYCRKRPGGRYAGRC